ncbi:MAG: hypothetical protein HQL80_03250 [Magnetococcales bacterium]|nr:hypothetical protein [Magnetococcales bacterium]
MLKLYYLTTCCSVLCKPKIGQIFWAKRGVFGHPTLNCKIDEQPVKQISVLLEQSVGARVVEFLETDRTISSIVSSVWMNIEYASKNTPDKIDGELDIAIVLKNAVVIHIDCKSFLAEEKIKALLAGQKSLEGASSRLAMTFYCLPIYTEYASEQWMLELLEAKAQLENRQHKVIGFTLPEQPKQYNTTDESGVTTSTSCPSFEDSLKKILTPYLPEALR